MSLGWILERLEAVWLDYWRKQGVQVRSETDLFVQVDDDPEAGY